MIRQALGRLLGTTEAIAEDTPTPEPSAPAPDPRLQAIDQVRATAKWLLLAFAAIGGVIVGSAPLSNVGKLEIHDWRLWAAAAAAAVVFIALAFAIWSTADVLTPVTGQLPQLVGNAQLRKLYAANPELLQGHGRTLEEFYDEYTRTRDACLDAYATHTKHPGDEGAARAATEAEAKLDEFTPVVARIGNQGLLTIVESKWTNARRFMFGAAFIAGVSIFVFAWAANPPAKKPGQSVAASGFVRPAVHGSGVVVTSGAARALLRRGGMSTEEADGFVQSFDGPIEAETLSKGAKFLRFATKPGGTGRFLTLSRFPDSTSARLALHLPWRNTARCLQHPTAKRRAFVLEGGVALGKPGVRQILVLNLKDFAFGRGRAFGREHCASS